MSEEPRGRDHYPHFLTVPTRWNDNDPYGHVNNIEYYGYFDTVINHWLINEGGLDIQDQSIVGFCAESHCRYHSGVTFPQVVEAGLRVGKLGNSSVRYEIGIFPEGENEPAAEGWFVHVFVDADEQEPTPIPERIRESLHRLTAVPE